ncbi:MAG: hypothetical protein ACPLYW_02700, partial [Candidatus Nanoarchaeia archaeon]
MSVIKFKFSKRGQGLGFAAVLILVIILYFIFRYHTETYEFEMTTGEDRAALMVAFAETEKAKVFVSQALQEAGYSALWNINRTNYSDAMSKAYQNKYAFVKNVSELFDIYLLKYASTNPDLTVILPDYNITASSWSIDYQHPEGSSITLDAYGYYEGCIINLSKYSYPSYPCEFQTDKSSCKQIPFTNGTSGACKWNETTKNCTQAISDPNCEEITDKNKCNSMYCIWDISYGENINVLHTETENRAYMFNILSNAYVGVTLTGQGAKYFFEKESLPKCNLYNNNNYLVLQYWDNLPPNSETKVTIDGTTYELSQLTEIDQNDKNYLDGKEYNTTKQSVQSANATVVDT